MSTQPNTVDFRRLWIGTGVVVVTMPALCAVAAVNISKLVVIDAVTPVATITVLTFLLAMTLIALNGTFAWSGSHYYEYRSEKHAKLARGVLNIASSVSVIFLGLGSAVWFDYGSTLSGWLGFIGMFTATGVWQLGTMGAKRVRYDGPGRRDCVMATSPAAS